MSTATTDNSAVREHAVRKELFVDGYEVVIGIEIHCQLNTESKIFSSAPTDFGHEPNSQANIVDLGLPGVLPVLNAGVVDRALKFGIGVNAELGLFNTFDRKNYFYPDLPKGYQITQMANPIVGEGYIDVVVNEGEKNEYPKRMGITRAHLEEDAGKSVHDAVDGMTGVDLNRAGTPLIEIVSEPDMRSAHEALAYIKAIHQLVTWLGISDAVMAEGSFRCDCNVSVRKPGAELGTRTELKNLNSFRFIERAINREIERQIDILEDGGKVVQATMLYDPERDETRTMRTKEDANDYRYFPDPDLLPVVIDDELLKAIKDRLPELPSEKKARFIDKFGLSEYDAENLTSQKAMADYYEIIINKGADVKLSANWVMGELSASLNKNQIDIQDSPIAASELFNLISRITDNTISGKIAKDVFRLMWDEKRSVDEIIKDQDLEQMTDIGALELVIDQIIAKNLNQVEQFKNGNTKLLGFFVGQVMKATQGKANPKQVNQILNDRLS